MSNATILTELTLDFASLLLLLSIGSSLPCFLTGFLLLVFSTALDADCCLRFLIRVNLHLLR
jgi:hypothetical protein